MKRFLLTIALFGLFALEALSQVHGNVIFSPAYNVEPTMRTGAALDFRLSSKYFFMPGVYWVKRRDKGVIELYTNDYEIRDVKESRADFIEVPLLVGIGFDYPQYHLHSRLFMGPYVGYGVGGNTTYTESKTYNTDSELDSETKTVYSAFGEDGGWKHRWDAGVHMGFEMYLYKHWVLGIYMEFGMVNKFDTPNNLAFIALELLGVLGKYNRAMGLNFGFRF